jgi:glycine/D-amino acid oxidase-like deaminating enzyme
MLNIQDLSYWERKTFLENIDFLIIGAGIVGYSTAIHVRMKYPDAKILILERGYLPSGASSKNAGFACFGSATELLDDLDIMAESDVWETVAKRWQGLQYLKSIIGEDHLKLEANGSWDLITLKQSDLLPLVRDRIGYLNEMAEKVTGQKNIYLEDKGLNEKFGFEGLLSSFHNRLEGQIDTGSMINRYYQKVVENNIHVLFGIEVNSFSPFENYVILDTKYGEIKCQNLLICTNGFAKQLISEDVEPARAQVLVTAPISNLRIKGTFHYDKGYYYFRNIDGRILLGGGRNLDFKGETTTNMETTEMIMNSLENLLREVILPNQEFKIDYRWSGIMGVGNTKAPIIKKINNRVGIGVRMGGMGVAIGSLVGKELSEMF